MTIAEPDVPAGTIITDGGKGVPFQKNVLGTWRREGVAQPLSWADILRRHDEAVADPDDDTTEPFNPVVMVPARSAAPANGACRMLHTTKRFEVEHYRCTDYADGVVTQVTNDDRTNGRIVARITNGKRVDA